MNEVNLRRRRCAVCQLGPFIHTIILILSYIVYLRHGKANKDYFIMCSRKVYLLHTKVKWRFKFIKIWVNVNDVVYEVGCGW